MRRSPQLHLAGCLPGSMLASLLLFATHSLAAAQASAPASAHAAAAQASAPAQPASSDSSAFDASIRVFPSPIWSRTAGFSAGVGLDVRNALMPRDRLLLAAKPGQHLGRYSATYFAGDPRMQSVYGLANVYYETTGRQWYYGTGPASSADDRIAVNREMVEVEVRAGVQLLGRRVFLQPSWMIHQIDASRFRNWDAGAVDRLSAASRTHLDAAVGALAASSARQWGMSFGGAAGIDLRDNPVRPERGLLIQASGRRFRFEEPDGLEYDQFAIGAYGYLLVKGNVLALRGMLERTVSDAGVVIPFYLLPSLDGRQLPGYTLNRFFGNDLLVLTAEYAVLLFEFTDFAALDLLFSAGAGSVYDDITDQFKAALSFDDRFDVDASRFPLRPSVGTGFSLQSASHGWDVRVLLGWGAEGVRLVKFGFIRDLQGIELNKR